MSVKVSCPTCETTLRSSKPIPPGKKVKCPKCGEVFSAPAEIAADAKSAGNPGAGARRDVPTAVLPVADSDPGLAKKPGKGKNKAPGKANRAEFKRTDVPRANKRSEPESEEVTTYGVVNDPDEGEKINYAVDTSIKDLRGPAISLLVKPSNALIYAGMMSAVFCLVVFAYCVWPWVFPLEQGEFLVDYEEVLKENNVPTDKWPKTAKATADNKEYKKMLDDAEDKEKTRRIIKAILAALQFVYNLVMAVGAVKMQNLESYKWAMAAAIMGINPMTLSGPGIWALVTLQKKEVKAGFEYKSDVD